MKQGGPAFFFTLLFILLLALSCVTETQTVHPEPVIETEQAPVRQDEPLPSQEATGPNVKAVEEEPVVTTEPDIPVEESEKPAEEAEFLVSEEVFTETFEDIRRLIDELNAIIREENYERWLKYLTDDYIAHFSSLEMLKENSEQPLLRKYNVQLQSLKDYFNYVVVPSRSNVRLDDLVFVDNEHVKAIMIFNDKRTILYQLEKSEEGWKIGL